MDFDLHRSKVIDSPYGVVTIYSYDPARNMLNEARMHIPTKETATVIPPMLSTYVSRYIIAPTPTMEQDA